MSTVMMTKIGTKMALLGVEGRSKRTTETYREIMKKFVESGHSLNFKGFVEFVDDLRENKSSAATVNLAIASGKKSFLQAYEKLGMSAKELTFIRGALAGIATVKIAPREVSVLTPRERETLFAALPLRIRLIAETLYMTGARVSEITGLRRIDVKKKGERVELRIRGKGSKERIVKITMELYQRILKVFPSGRYLFTTSQGHPYYAEYISNELGRAGKRVLGRLVSAHVLRHSRATDLIEATGKIKGVSRLLGHASEATTLKFYVKQSLTDEELFNGTTK